MRLHRPAINGKQRLAAARLASHLYGNVYRLVGKPREHLHVGDIALGPCHEHYLAGNTVPVALCLVGYAVRVLTNAYVLDAIVEPYPYLVRLAISQIWSKVELVWHAERGVAACMTAIDIDVSLNMRTLKEERYPLPLPLPGYIDGTAVPRLTNIMA